MEMTVEWAKCVVNLFKLELFIVLLGWKLRRADQKEKRRSREQPSFYHHHHPFTKEYASLAILFQAKLILHPKQPLLLLMGVMDELWRSSEGGAG